MKAVSRFEANLLWILQFFLRKLPLEQVQSAIGGRLPAPKCLSRDAVGLVQDTLAKGWTRVLAGGLPGPLGRAGGWRRERFLRNGRIADGRLWERTPPAELGLGFSGHSLRFLIWMTASSPRADAAGWACPEKELALGDWLLFYLAYSALRQTDIARPLGARPGFAHNVLGGLGCPGELPGDGDALDFTPWTSGVGACVLEALEPELMEAWLASQRDKGRTIDRRRLQEAGRREEQVLAGFLDAVEAAGRPDLARFLLRAAARLVTEDATVPLWLNPEAVAGIRLADRLQTGRLALTLVRYLDRFRHWEQDSRGIGYYDDGYAASQLLKADWERHGGDRVVQHAQRLLRELDPLQGEATA